MTALFVSFSIASALTAIYAFRYSHSREPGRLARYFLLFFIVEWLGEHLFLPTRALGAEVGGVALFIAGLFVVAIVLRDRYDPE